MIGIGAVLGGAKAGWAMIARNWGLLAMVALLVFSGWQTLRVAWAKADLAEAAAELGREIIAHDATMASLARVMGELEDQNEKVRALAEQGAARQAAAAKALADARAANAAQAGTIAALRASSGSASGDGQCPVSETLAAVRGL